MKSRSRRQAETGGCADPGSQARLAGKRVIVGTCILLLVAACSSESIRREPAQPAPTVAVTDAAHGASGVSEPQSVEESEQSSSGSAYGTPPAEESLVPVAINYDRVVVETRFSCVIRFETELVCFGFRESPLAVPPGEFESIIGRGDGVCGITTSSQVVCWQWREDNFGDVAIEMYPVPSGEFRRILFTGSKQAGATVCGLKVDGAIFCWWWDAKGLGETDYQPYDPTFREGFVTGFETVSGLCGVRRDKTLVCSGSRSLANPPSGKFTQVSTYFDDRACAIREDQRVVCWGSGSANCDELYPPEQKFQFVSIDNGCVACGIVMDGSIVCWGGWYGDQQFAGAKNPPDGSFVEIVGTPHDYCGIRRDGDLVCWDVILPHDSPHRTFVGPFESIGLGDFVQSCAVRTNGSILCWPKSGGADRYMKWSPPA